MGMAHLHDQRFNLDTHLVRARVGPGAPVGEGRQSAGRVLAQPPVHALAGHAIAPGDVTDAGPVVEHLQHRPKDLSG